MFYLITFQGVTVIAQVALWIYGYVIMVFLDVGRQLYKIALFPVASDLKSFFTRSLER